MNTHTEIVTKIMEIGIVPVVRASSAQKACLAAEAVAAAGIPIVAGALTPTEIITAWNTGADFVKVFPCSAVGGANYIKAIRGPLPEVPLVPTGGVNLNTAADFIKAGAVALGIGGELCSPAALDCGDASVITAVGKEYLKIVQQARGAAQESLTGKAS